MSKFKNQKLSEMYLTEMEAILTRANNLTATLTKYDPIIEQVQEISPSWFISGKLYIPMFGADKPEFSAAVTKLSSLLGEPPSIRVDAGQYLADFNDSQVQVYAYNPSDCRVIEEEEVKTVKTLKPHPACLAALKVLEDIA